MFVLPGWGQGEALVTLRAPDLRNFAEWNADMALVAQTRVDWSISITDQDRPFDAPIGAARRGVRNTMTGWVSPGQSPFARTVQ
jgi:hypothetical protein